MRIAIVGVGAMGCLFAGRLSGRTDFIMVGNWPEQLATLRQDGLTFIHPDGSQAQHRVQATNDPGRAGPADLVLILVKSPQTQTAAAVARQVLTQSGLALTLQNGLGNLEIMAGTVGDHRAALGVTSEGATMIGPGIVRHAGRGVTHLAATPVTRERLQAVANLFQAIGFESHLVDNPTGLVWAKLAVNAGINPLTALLQVPNGFLAEHPVARELMSQAALETAAVAQAQGIELPYADAAQRAREVALATAANRSSMAQDVARGAPTEIEAICGAIVAAGRRWRVDTPVNEAFLLLIRSQTEAGEWRHRVEELPAGLRPALEALASLEN